MPKSKIIPFIDSPCFTENVILEGIQYNFYFYWNTTAGFWSLDVSNSDLQAIITGLKLVLNYDLFSQCPGRGLPPGKLYIFDVTGSVSDIAQNDFITGRLQIVYVESI
jgi:hypothetical protein